MGFGCLLGLAAAVLIAFLPARDYRTSVFTALLALLIAMLFVAAESSQIHIEVRQQAWSVSLSELPFVIGLFLLPPWWLLVGRLVAAGTVFWLRRTSAPKTIFNLGLFAAEVALAAVLFRALHAGNGLHARDWAIAYFVMLVVSTTGALTVITGLALQRQHVATAELARTLPVAGLAAAFNTTLALLSLLVVDVNSGALVLLGAFVAVVAMGYRAYQRLQRQHADLGQLFAFTQSIGLADSTDDMLNLLLAKANDLMQAEQSVLLMPPAEGLAAAAGGGPEIPLGAVVLPRGTRDPVSRAYLAQAGLRDALLVPVHDGDRVIGVLQVGNRIGAMSTFTAEDLRLLQTLTAHTEALRAHGRLLELRRHEAHHDSLTGLANRELFLLRVQESLAPALVAPRPLLERVAIMLLDLNRFREINDTLGHHVGDLVLREVGTRLQDAIPAGAVVARLGGDEFAVLVRNVVDPAAIMDVARHLTSSLTDAFEVADISLEVSAAIGVAIAPEDGDVATILLQHADIAMYAAKRTEVKMARYSAGGDQTSVTRLALAGELRRAIDANQLIAYYQPKMHLRSRTVVSFEALVRWQHPTHGLLPPDEFVPIAERVGLIGPLTGEVLTQALNSCRNWLPEHPGVGVAVNLSAQGLLEPTLPATVARLLAETGVAAGLLTLEITETSVMSDFDAALAALRELHSLGVQLSVDDFGTGYSSLAYLMQLPVQEVKIDKSFVIAMIKSPDAEAIVRAIVGLSHTLRLTVVAEGVEDEASLSALDEMGCDTAQGYLLSRPMSPEALSQWSYPVPTPRALHPVGQSVARGALGVEPHEEAT